MDTLLAATSTVTTLVGDVWDMVVANPMLTVIAAAGLITLAVGVFGAIKGAAHF